MICLKLIFFISVIYRRNLDYFETCHFSAMQAVDADNGNGEVTVRIPPEAYPLVMGEKYLEIGLGETSTFPTIG